MVSKRIHWLSIFSFIVIVCLTAIPAADVHALTDPAVTDLAVFVEQVKNGQADELRGIYISGILAAPIIQQPTEQADFVSPWQNVVTQFSLASRVGSTGLLAHNYLAGQSFVLLENGQEFYLVYGDGRVDAFAVSEILQYRALEPASTSSTFVDLENGSTLTHVELFMNIYDRPGQVILQTCISMNDDPSGGRLFIIAKPSLE
jgi:hypothetical protein